MNESDKIRFSIDFYKIGKEKSFNFKERQQQSLPKSEPKLAWIVLSVSLNPSIVDWMNINKQNSHKLLKI